MNTFVLIIFFHVGMLGDGNSNSVTSVPNFKTKEACEAAGQATKKVGGQSPLATARFQEWLEQHGRF